MTDALETDAAPPARYRPSHIAGDARRLTDRQRQLVARAAALGPAFAERAARHDREASFPAENYEELRQSGLLAICVPESHGGLGADFETYMLVAAELGRWCGSTALSFNMHVQSSLWAGLVADALEMTPTQRADHERLRARHFERIVRGGWINAHPFSEGGASAAGSVSVWSAASTSK